MATRVGLALLLVAEGGVWTSAVVAMLIGFWTTVGVATALTLFGCRPWLRDRDSGENTFLWSSEESAYRPSSVIARYCRRCASWANR
jgi:hypothetical protein